MIVFLNSCLSSNDFKKRIMLYCVVMCCVVLCCAVLCCAVLCCAVLCCAVLDCTVLFFTVLHYTVIFHNKLSYPRARSAIPRFIPWMSRVLGPANQTALDSCLRAKLTCFRWYDRSDRLISSESHGKVIVFIVAAMTKFGTPHCPKWEIPNLSIYTSSNGNS